jgi:hypothetical protein
MSVVQDLTAEALQALGYRPIHAGDDYDLSITAQIDGVAIDLTGGIAWFTVKEDAIDTDVNAKLQLKSDNVAELEITDPANGVMKIYLREPTTKDLEGLWPYDLQVKTSGGTIITVGRGDIEFLPNLTRDNA